jgi:uncharacterized RDD family membrane protein YckC
VSRAVAAGIDIGIVLVAYELVLVAWGITEALFKEKQFDLPTPSVWLSSSSLLLLFVVVLAGAWAGAGRTVGDTLMGLRVIRETGEDLGFVRALLRAVVLVVVPVVSMGWILVSRKNAGLHDLVCRTTVIYDWRPRHRTRTPPPDGAAAPAGAGQRDTVAPPAPAPVPSAPVPSAKTRGSSDLWVTEPSGPRAGGAAPAAGESRQDR